MDETYAGDIDPADSYAPLDSSHAKDSARTAATVAALAHSAPCHANRQTEIVTPARRHRSRHRIVASDAQIVTNGPMLTPISRAISRRGSLSVTDSGAR